MSLESRRTWAAPEELIATLRAARHLHRKLRIGQDDYLYHQGELSTRFYLIESGLIKVGIFREDGVEIILEFMGAGTVCGEGSALDCLPRFSSAVAVEAAEVLEFDTAQWPADGAESALVLMALLRITAIKQRVLAQRLEQLFSREPEGRILDLFQRLARTAPGVDAVPAGVLPQLTHDHIAAMTGMTRVTVTRSLNRLRSRGFIIQEEGRFRLASLPIETCLLSDN
ncbi:MAG: Crp/Fnr family transcriptional regulator [Pararhodobacter sp.]|nr:Crp/Fnr family transcriptional regulator [Pararhodobacter sp.]